MTYARDVLVDLMAGKLAAFTGLCSLRHFDLEFIRTYKVLARHTESRRCHLLDRAVARVAIGIQYVAGRIFASLSGITPAADAVHRDGERFVSFLTDRTE